MKDAAPAPELLSFTLNGTPVSVPRPARGHLGDLLRNELRLTGTHLGCEQGVCGACNVLIDGRATRACLTQPGQVEGRDLRTVEGLTADGTLKSLQDAFLARNALQCGFCTPGMLLTAKELLEDDPTPTREAIRDAISGNICRCTGYHAIVDAIEDVARGRAPAAPEAEGVGAPLPRAAARRAAEGRGSYLDDVTPARCGHVAFVRSPYAHARMLSHDLDEARAAPGVIAVVTGAELAEVSPPWTTVLNGVRAHRSPPQPAMAVDEVCWQGEAVVAVVAETRALAEDAAELVWVDYEELPALADPAAALAPDAPKVHSALESNLALDQDFALGDAEAAFARAAFVAEQSFAFSRQTGVTLEPRGILAEWDPALEELRVRQSHQAPFQSREIFAEQLGLSPDQVRVTAPDVGGAFGLKLHAYADEMAVAALAMLLDRPVKFAADRLESFAADAHAREAEATARIAVDADGKLLGFEVEMLAGFGAYSMYPRGSVGEALQAVSMIGAPYGFDHFRGRVRGALQNKAPTGAYRGVGQPIACAVTEQLMDLAAAGIGLSPEEIRRRNLLAGGAEISPLGLRLEPLSTAECLAKLEDLADIPARRAEHARLRAQGVTRGLGVACFVEMTGVGSRLYGPLGVAVAAQETVRLTLETGGRLRAETSVTDQGQGTLSALAQVAAEGMGVAASAVTMVAGDTQRTPYGGGAWASRGMALGGEAMLRASARLRDAALQIAAALLQRPAESLEIAGGEIRVAGEATGPSISLDQLARTARYSPHDVPLPPLPPLTVEETFLPQDLPYLASNGVAAIEVEVDAETGVVSVLGAWAVDDCGRVVNPLLVDEQLRGGLVQGIGAALYEECVYSEDGQLQTGTLADYLLPMAAEMPDIALAHVTTPTRATRLGAKGVGEAGLVAGPAAVRCAVNDALRPLGGQVIRQPYSPARILAALGVGEEDDAG